MNSQFLAHVVRTVLAEGECYLTEQVSAHLDSRERVDPRTIEFKAAVVERFQSISEGNDYLLVSVKLIDRAGSTYLAHLNTQWDQLFTSWASTVVIPERDLRPQG